MIWFWLILVFCFGICVWGLVEAFMDRDYPRDDRGNKMTDRQALKYLIGGQRIQTDFLGKILNLQLAQEVALREILSLLKAGADDEAVGFGLTVTMEDGTILEDPIMAELTASQQMVVRIKPKTKGPRSKPADVQAGSVEWSSSDEAVLMVTEDTNDQLSATVKAMGAGNAQVRFSGDSDLGDGVVTISGLLDVQVTPDQATTFDIETDPPTEQPDVPAEG